MWYEKYKYKPAFCGNYVFYKDDLHRLFEKVSDVGSSLRWYYYAENADTGKLTRIYQSKRHHKKDGWNFYTKKEAKKKFAEYFI